MEVPITQFRRDMFALVNRALEGETITLAYKGKRLRIVPEIDPKTRFDRVTPLQVINPDYPDIVDDAEMKAEMQAEWERDWDEQGLV
jgi:antitoxin (DNA-binding transcriptional repressor) of toxin-antitoxin stability system